MSTFFQIIKPVTVMLILMHYQNFYTVMPASASLRMIKHTCNPFPCDPFLISVRDMQRSSDARACFSALPFVYLILSSNVLLIIQLNGAS